jgi:Arc/MetJ-type ribon-helix-helix transcriptional regulator
MVITLDQDVESFLEEQLRQGVCTDPSELVNDILRALSDQKVNPFAVTPELEAWLLESADKPSTPLTAADFSGIRDRIQSRLRSSVK